MEKELSNVTSHKTTQKIFCFYRVIVMAVFYSVVMLPLLQAQTVTSTTGELRANSIVAGTVENYWWSMRTLAVQPDGGSIVVWVDYGGNDGSGNGIYARMFNADNTPKGSQFLVNTTTSGDQFAPCIAVAPNGEFVIGWEGPGTSTDVWGQLYTKDGIKKGTEFLLSTTINGNQRYPEIVYMPDGTFVAGFVDGGAVTRLQKFDANARSIGQETALSSSLGNVIMDGITEMPDGNLLVFWSQGNGSNDDVYAQIFTQNQLTPIGNPTKLNTYTSGLQRFSIGRTDADGNIVFAWESESQDGSGFGIYAQRFTSNLTPVGAEFRVNNVTAYGQYGAGIVITPGGDFIISWVDDGNLDAGGTAGGSSGTSCWFQQYDKDANEIGNEQRINTSTAGQQEYPLGSINAAGKITFDWMGNGTQTGQQDDSGIFTRSYQFSQTGTTSMSVSSYNGIAGDIVTVSMTLTNPTSLTNVEPNPMAIYSSNGSVFAKLVSGPNPVSATVGTSAVTFTWTYKLTAIDNGGYITFGNNAHTNSGAIFPFAASQSVTIKPALFVSDLTAPNLSADANKPATDGPRVFTIGAKATNASLNQLSDVVVYIGDGTTPGTFPITTMTLSNTNNTYQGTFSLTPLSGSTDCTRPLITLGAAQPVIDGYVDFNRDGIINTADDGLLNNGKNVIDGKVDANNDGQINSLDNTYVPGKFYDWREAFVYNGLVDVDGDGTVTSNDDGTYGGETRNLYWQVQYATVDAYGVGTFGNAGDLNDDLRYNWVTWVTGIDNGVLRTDYVYEFAKVRSELSASANKITPSGGYVTGDPPVIYDGMVDINKDGSITTTDDGTYFGKNIIDGKVDIDGNGIINTSDDGTLSGFPVVDAKIDVTKNGTVSSDDDGILVQTGQTFTLTFHNVDFGTVGAGFDENRDGISDYDLWYQPVGKLNWPTGSFRLVDIQSDFWGKNTNIDADNLVHYNNEPYLSQINGANSNGYRADYSYTFLALAGGTGTLSPYQEAASGVNEGKYNGDFGTGVNVYTGSSGLTLTKTGTPETAYINEKVSWSMTYQNISTTNAGEPGSGNGVVVDDSIPSYCSYVAGSAYYLEHTATIYYSTDKGATWSSIEPQASFVTNIRWHVEEPILPNGTGTVGFKTIFTNCPAHNTVVTNKACLRIGTGDILTVATDQVTVINNKPVAVDDINVTYTKKTVSGSVLSNDYDPQGNPLTVNTTPVTMPTHGTLILSSGGIYTYTPSTYFVGEDYFVYSVCDNETPQNCTTARVKIQVLPLTIIQNNPVVAINDPYKGTTNTTVTGNVLNNDLDLNFNLNPNSVSLVGSLPDINTKGTLTLQSNGDFTFVPVTGFAGVVDFYYAVNDYGSPVYADTALVSINIQAFRTSTCGNSTFAVDDAYFTLTNTVINGNVKSNDYDPELNTQTVNTSLVSMPSRGTVTMSQNGTFVYTPTKNFNGVDQFMYEICDNGNPRSCNRATVYITVSRKLKSCLTSNINVTSIPKTN